MSADRLNTGTVGRVATSIGAMPSSDSGIHSWKEQWENMSELSSDDASGQPVQPDWSGPERATRATYAHRGGGRFRLSLEGSNGIEDFVRIVVGHSARGR